MLLVLGVFGSLIGSFLNVVVHRVPAGISVVSPPSACPACGARVRSYDNIPIVSWLVLRGRCRDCRAGIPARYPLVEAGTALAFAVVAWRFLPATGIDVADLLRLVSFLAFAAASIALALIDLDVSRLPDAIVLPSLVLAVTAAAVEAAVTGDLAVALRALAGGAATGALYLGLALIRRGGMGMGDVKLAAVLGVLLAWLGWTELLVGVVAGFLLGGLAGVVLLLARRAGRSAAIPFGPWMLAGAWLAILVGPAVADAYLSLFGLRGP